MYIAAIATKTGNTVLNRLDICIEHSRRTSTRNNGLIRENNRGYTILIVPYPAAVITVAVGTTIADRPPHRSVQARLRIRLLSWMSGGEASIGIRMQNAGLRNPPGQERGETIPSHLGALTATD